MRLRERGRVPRFGTAAGVVLALVLAGCGAPRTALTAVRPPVPAAAPAPEAAAEPAAPTVEHVPAGTDERMRAPRAATAAATPERTPAPRDAFEVGGAVVAIVGTYSDCTGRTAVGTRGAYYEPCMGLPYWIGHHAVLGAILAVDTLTYWDGGGTAHRWHVIGRRVLRAGAAYPGPLPGAEAELQTCLEATDTSPVQIVDYAT